MKTVNKIRKFSQAKSFIGLAIAGILIATICTAVLMHKDEVEFVKTEAVVSDLVYSEGSEPSVEEVKVDYEVGGVKFTGISLSSFSGDLEIGQEIEIEYNPQDPQDARQPGGKMMAAIIGAIGLLAAVFGIYKASSVIHRKSSDYEQFNKAAYMPVNEAAAEEVRNSTETQNDYIFHFTGHLNQDYVMKDSKGTPVLEAVCDKLQLIKDTKYIFKDCASLLTEEKMISHTLTISDGAPFGFNFRIPISSCFKVDGKSCWDVLAEQGYGFDFSLRGLAFCYDVKHHGVNVAHIESAGTEILNDKYKNNPLAKLPANGLFRISCRKSDAKAVFFICFVLSRIEIFSSASDNN